jgi:hypothetical protein
VIAITRNEQAGKGTGIERLRRCTMRQLSARLRENGDSAGSELALLSCGPMALAREMLETTQMGSDQRWERVVAIGTTSTVSKRSSTDESERRMIAEIEIACGAIRERCRAHAIPLTVLSPTLIYGCGMDQNLSRVFRWVRRAGFAPLAAEASGLRQPVHVADLANTIVTALQFEPAPELESAVCGGSTLSYQEMMGLLFDAAGRNRRFLRVPEAAFSSVAGAARFLPGIGEINREMFRRQASDLVFDDGPARKILGHAPRPLSPSEADFRLPPEIESIRRALV